MASETSAALATSGIVTGPPERMTALVVVPVGGMSRLTREAISAALSLGDEVTAVTVCYSDPEEEKAVASFRRQWEEWDPDVPLISLHTAHRSLAPPIVVLPLLVLLSVRVVVFPEVAVPVTAAGWRSSAAADCCAWTIKTGTGLWCST